MTGDRQDTHTAGDWRVDVNGSDGWSVDYDGPSSTFMTICGDRRAPVAFVVEPSAYGNDAEIEANARLIAAAPDLLAALELALPYVEDASDSASPADQDFIRAALSKAKTEKAGGEGAGHE